MNTLQDLLNETTEQTCHRVEGERLLRIENKRFNDQLDEINCGTRGRMEAIAAARKMHEEIVSAHRAVYSA